MLQNTRTSAASFPPGSTVLSYTDELSAAPDPRSPLQALLGPPGDSEGSSSSEGSHATGDLGHYSHDETEMTNLSSSGHSSRQPSLAAEDGGGEELSGPTDLEFVEKSGRQSACFV